MSRLTGTIQFKGQTLTFSANETENGRLNPATLVWDHQAKRFLQQTAERNNVCFMWLDELCEILNETGSFQEPVSSMHLGID